MINVLAWQHALAQLPDDVAIVMFNGRYNDRLPAIKLRAAGRCEVYLTPDNDCRLSCIEGAVTIACWRPEPRCGHTTRQWRPWTVIIQELAAVARSARPAP